MLKYLFLAISSIILLTNCSEQNPRKYTVISYSGTGDTLGVWRDIGYNDFETTFGSGIGFVLNGKAVFVTGSYKLEEQ